jgi:photosystem II stability/assembly factor-like uncharacterized protein
MKTNTLKSYLLLTFIAISMHQVSAQWQQTNGPVGGYINCFSISGSNIFAATEYNGVFLSTNNGNSWTPVVNGFPVLESVTCMAINGANIFAGTLSDGIYRSTNNGTSWTPVNNGISNPYIHALVVCGGYVLAATYYGLFRSSDNGNNWVLVNTISPQAFAISGNNIFGAQGGVVLSTDNGLTWVSVSNGLPPGLNVNSLAISGSNIFAGIWQGGVYRSSNNGNSWVVCNSGLPDLRITRVAASGSNIFAGTYQNGIFYSPDNGSNWVAVNNGYPSIQDITALAIDGNNIYSGSWGLGIYQSSDNGTTWTEKNTGLIEVLGGSFAMGDTVFAGTAFEGIFKSYDNGNNWIAINNGLVCSTVNSIEANGNNLWTCTDHGIYLSLNYGSSWSQVGATYPFFNSKSIVFSGNNIFVATFSMGVYLSTDNGTTWTAMNNGLPFLVFINPMIKSGNNLLAGTSNGMYLSSDNANSWAQVTSGLPSNSYIYSLCICNNFVFASTQSGVFKSSDNGLSWSPANNGLGSNVVRFAVSGSIIFAGAGSHGAYVSYDYGANWIAMSDGLLGNSLGSLSVTSNNIFASVYGKGIWKFPACVPVITGADSLCGNSGFYYYATDAGMNNYTWDISPGGTITSGQGSNQVQVKWMSPGQQWVTVNYGSTYCAELVPAYFNVTVLPAPGQAGSITGPDTVCAGDKDVAYSVAPISNTLVYVWTLPAGATITSGTGTTNITVDFSANASSGNMSVYGNNLCGNGTESSLPVTINPIPPTPFITQNWYVLGSNAPSGNQWYWEGTQIPGATTQYYTATQNGHFWDVVTLYGCSSDTSNHIYIVDVGISDKNQSLSVDLYPSPNNGLFTIQVTTSHQYNIHLDLYNSLGVNIYSESDIKVTGMVKKIVDLQSEPNGVYTIVLRNNGYVNTRKFVINR